MMRTCRRSQPLSKPIEGLSLLEARWTKRFRDRSVRRRRNRVCLDQATRGYEYEYEYGTSSYLVSLYCTFPIYSM